MSAQTYRLTLLGDFTLHHDTALLDRFASRQEERLLAYLALRPGVAVRRAELVAVFWADLETAKARKLLSLYLFKLKARLAASGLDDGIEGARETLRLSPAVRTDVQEFAELVLAGTLAQSPIDRTRHLLAAVEMYGSGLLPAYAYPWVDELRKRLAILHREAVVRLADGIDPSGRTHALLESMPPEAWRGLIRLAESQEPTPSSRSQFVTTPPAKDAARPDGSRDDLKAVVRAAEAELNSADRHAAVERLNERLDEIRAVLSSSPSVADYPERLAMAARLWRYWYLTGAMAEGRAYIEALLPRSDEAHVAVRAAALHAAGTLANLLGERAAGIPRLEEATGLWFEIGDDPALLSTVVNLALARHDAEHYEEAREAHAQAVGLARRLGRTTSLARALFNSALTELKLGHGASARALLEERSAMPIVADDPALRGSTMAHLASVALLEGNLGGARLQAERAVQDLATTSDLGVHAFAECVMGRILYHEDRLAEARDSLRAAADHARASRDMKLTGDILGYLATVYERMGDTANATQCTINASLLLRSAGATDDLDQLLEELRDTSEDQATSCA